MARQAHAAAIETGQTVRLVVDVTPAGRIRRVQGAPERPEPSAVDTTGGGRLGEALKHALQRGERRAAEILDGPEMLNSDTMAERLGVSRETVNRMRQRGELLGLEGARRGVRYPDWQLVEPGQLPLPQMAALFRVLGDPWSVYRFLMQTHPELAGRRALDALLQGDAEPAVGLAGDLGAGLMS